MEQFTLDQWNSSGYNTVDVPTKSNAVVTAKRYYPDLVVYNVTIKVKNIHNLGTVSKTDFNVGTDQQWRFKFSPYGLMYPKYYACAIYLMNYPKFYPVHISAVITSSSTKLATSMSKSVMPLEVWGFKYQTMNHSSFLFEMEIFEKVPVIYNSIQQVDDKKETNDEIQLLDHSKLLFTAGDLTLFGPDWEHCCHKQVLVDKSPVFKAMFEHDMIENETSRVEVKDIKGPAVRAMLLYMYTDEPVGLSTHINELTYAAVKYQIEDLKTHCINYMMNNLSVESATDFVFLSDLCDSKTLRDRIISYIKLNLRNISQTTGWQQVEKLSKTLSRLIEHQACIYYDD